MKYLKVLNNDLFYYYNLNPEVENLNNWQHDYANFMREITGNNPHKELFLFRDQNKVYVVAKTMHSWVEFGDVNSVKEFILDEIEGIVLRNTRSARGRGIVNFEIKLKDGRLKDLFIFFIEAKSSDPMIWDQKVSVFETEIMPEILAFMGKQLLSKVEDYNC